MMMFCYCSIVGDLCSVCPSIVVRYRAAACSRLFVYIVRASMLSSQESHMMRLDAVKRHRQRVVLTLAGIFCLHTIRR